MRKRQRDKERKRKRVRGRERDRERERERERERRGLESKGRKKEEVWQSLKLILGIKLGKTNIPAHYSGAIAEKSNLWANENL